MAKRPPGVLGRLRADRPGQYVLLDSYRLDVFAMEPVTLRWVNTELTVAMDLYDRCITGLRLRPVAARSPDVASVLFQTVTPQTWGWAAGSAEGPYAGLPDVDPGAVVGERGAGVNRWAAWLRDNGPGRFQLANKSGWDTFVNTAPRADLEVLSRAEMAKLSGEELEDYTEARMVWNANLPTVKTQLTSAFAVIEQVMASNRRDADRLCGSVNAAPGLGKTTIATRYARHFHRNTYRRHGPKTGSGHQRLPVAFVPLSAGMTLKGLNQ